MTELFLSFFLAIITTPEFLPPKPLVECHMNEVPHIEVCQLIHGLDRPKMVIA